MEKLKVVNIGSDAIEFENGVKLYSNHDSDCCESHKLTLSDLTMADFEGLEFDLTNDGLPDIYIANDYEEPDIFYMNQGNGKFGNIAQNSLKHMSNFSMG